MRVNLPSYECVSHSCEQNLPLRIHILTCDLNNIILLVLYYRNMSTNLDFLPQDLQHSFQDVLSRQNNTRKELHDRHTHCMPTPHPKTNKAVVYHWLNNRDHSSLNMSTNGNNLYSYAMIIGYTNETGEKILEERTAKNDWFISSTTSCHVGLARPYADKILLE